MMTSFDYRPSMTLEMAQRRAQMLAKIRQFFFERKVLEVQTPVMSQAGNTDVFVPSVSANLTVYDTQTTYYLHTSPEFAMKRLLASWQVPIYQICPVFRDNEVGERHNSEFTMLEWYRPGFSLAQLGDELTALLAAVFGYRVIMTHYSYSQAFIDLVGIHPLTASCDALAAVAKDKGLVGVDFGDDHQGWLDLLFSHLIEPKLGHDMPTLITDYPPATAALAKIKQDRDGHDVASRFELYIKGIEIANAYDELADADALKRRFKSDNLKREELGLAVMPIDERLLAACEQMPACSGIAVGIDRLLMVLTDTPSIKEVMGFTVTKA